MRVPLPAAAFALSVGLVIALSLVAMAGHLDLSSIHHRIELESGDALSQAEHELSEVRRTMGVIQSRAVGEHTKAADEARAAAKDRALEKHLNNFAAERQQDAQSLQQQSIANRAAVNGLNDEVSALHTSIHQATLSIKQLAAHMQTESNSRPSLRKEMSDVSQRLLDLSNEHGYLEEKARVLAVAAGPHTEAYAKDDSDLTSMQLQVHQLKAQARLFNAQASVIADNLGRKLSELKKDQAVTARLKAASDALPAEDTVKLQTPKFVSLAAKAKSIYSKAGVMIGKVEADNKQALAEKLKLVNLEKQVASVDQKAAAIDMTAAKLSAATTKQQFLAEHLKDDARAAQSKLAASTATIKKLKAKRAMLIKKQHDIVPDVKKDKTALQLKEKELLKDQTLIDQDKAKVNTLSQTLTTDKAKLKADIAGAQKDLKLAVGAAKAARVHEKRSKKQAKKAAVDDKRVDKLSAELAVSDRKVSRARALVHSAEKARKDLDDIEKDTKA